MNGDTVQIVADLERALAAVQAELAEAQRLHGAGSSPSLAMMKAGGWWRSLSPKTSTLWEATYFAGLRKAGVPEE